MAHFLSRLLEVQDPTFEINVRRLERLTGNRGIDVGYIGDITRRAHAVMRRIGLDTIDTTEQELYQALNAHAEDTGLLESTSDVGLMYDGRVVSFNREDIQTNKTKPYEQRTTAHMRCEIRHGLSLRYREAAGAMKGQIEEVISEMKLETCDMTDYHDKKVDKQISVATKPRMLFVGDIFTDTFIQLREDEARIDTDEDGSKRLSLPFGTKPPYERADIVTSVGPSPNAAVACARLGANVSLMSWLGDDKIGKDSLAYLTSEGIDISQMVTQQGVPSNSYYVLRYGADRTILIKNEQYDYRWRDPEVEPDWIYLSLLDEDSWDLHLDLLHYLEQHPHVKLAFQPGTFHFKWGKEKLAEVYKRSYIVVMNREEAMEVTGLPYDSVYDLAMGLHELGSDVVVVTDGSNGSYALVDGKLEQIPNYPDPAPPFDRTGAGDAFASTIVAALALGKSIEEALTWAPINSMSVVQKLGAQAGLLRQEEIEEHLKTAPEDYKPTEIKPE